MVEIDHLYILTDSDFCYLTVFEIDYLVGIFYDRSGITGDIEVLLVGSYSYHQWT